MRTVAKSSIDAEAIAIEALSHIASDAERLGSFLNHTGLTPETLRRAASEPGFFAQVLEFVSADDATLLAFAANAGLRPENIVRARQVLAGPQGHEF